MPAIDTISNADQLDQLLSEPTPGVLETVGGLRGDFLVLGAGGKMGPSLSRMLKRAVDATGGGRKVIGVSRFGEAGTAARLQASGIETIASDLLDTDQLRRLPDAPNVVYLAGMKFGSSGNEDLTWAMNAWLPALVCERFRRSRIVALSTGNIYGLTPVVLGGSIESDAPNPQGDYAMSCLGRERMFGHFSRSLHLPVAVIRLNYASELRYGVIVDLARRVLDEKEIDLSMGNVNIIWQADASAMIIRAFDHASSPAFVLNVAGPEMLSVRRVCVEMGRLAGKTVRFRGVESADSLLSNGGLGHSIFGYPRVSAGQMIRWAVDWVSRGGEQLGKPTHFETRDGRF